MKALLVSISALIFGALFLSCQPQTDMAPVLPTSEDNFYLSKMKADIAMKKSFVTFLEGRQEVPSVAASGSGHASFQLRDDGMSLQYQLFVANTEGILASHIHLAPMGQNGPVVAFLLGTQDPPTPLFNGLLAEGTIEDSDLIGPLAGMTIPDLVEAIKKGDTYVNVHTSDHPGGELRGQIRIQKPSENNNYTLHLSGDEEVPPVDTNAQGNAMFKFNSDQSALHFKIKVANLDDALFAHIHIAPKGANGGVVVTLKGEMVAGPINGEYAEGTITDADLSGIMTGGDLSLLKAALDGGHAYVNVHSPDFPGGEIRGQF